MARRQYYPTREVQPATVEVWRRAKGEPPAAARLVGLYRPGESGSFDYNPQEDRNPILSTVSIAPDGTRGVRELTDAIEHELTFQRETTAPVIGLFNDATADSATVAVTEFSGLVTRRRVRIAESLTMGGDLDDPSEQIFEYGPNEVPKYIDILRAGAMVPDFTYTGNDPETNGFTKTGSGLTEANAGGWRIDTTLSDAATYFEKTSWPGSAFSGGFTLELAIPPFVITSDNPSPAQCVAFRIEDGTHRFELTFDASGNVALNGGSSHAIANMRIRLVVATGGATADLWIGDTEVETATASGATATSGLSFGDLVTTDDADVVWPGFTYQLDSVPVRLAQTIYVAVAHSSGGAFTPDSNILEVTFANEGSGAGGSTGEFNPEPKDTYEMLV